MVPLRVYKYQLWYRGEGMIQSKPGKQVNVRGEAEISDPVPVLSSVTTSKVIVNCGRGF